MKTDDYIEIINNKRIEIYNSKEYKIGVQILKIKKMILKMQFAKLIYLIVRHKKIKKLSISNPKYGMIKKNNDDISSKKIVIYTCITGNYDSIIEPYFKADNVDYILFTDKNMNNINETEWIIKKIDSYKILEGMTMVEKNRFIKMNPYFLFQDNYDYAIYIDGNIGVVSDIRKLINSVDDKYGISMHKHRNRDDIYAEYKVCKLLKKGNINQMKKQINCYKDNGFPKKYGMLEANVIVCNLKNNFGKKIMNEWWEEFKLRNSGRDQISLIFILWKNKIKVNEISNLGYDVYNNPIFWIYEHKNGGSK